MGVCVCVKRAQKSLVEETRYVPTFCCAIEYKQQQPVNIVAAIHNIIVDIRVVQWYYFFFFFYCTIFFVYYRHICSKRRRRKTFYYYSMYFLFGFIHYHRFNTYAPFCDNSFFHLVKI